MCAAIKLCMPALVLLFLFVLANRPMAAQVMEKVQWTCILQAVYKGNSRCGNTEIKLAF